MSGVSFTKLLTFGFTLVGKIKEKLEETENAQSGNDTAVEYHHNLGTSLTHIFEGK